MLISTGCDSFDRLLGGGLPLGTLTIVQEDSVSSNHGALIKYFVGEGIACQQVAPYAKSDRQHQPHAQSVFLSVPQTHTAEDALSLVPLCSKDFHRSPVGDIKLEV